MPETHNHLSHFLQGILKVMILPLYIVKINIVPLSIIREGIITPLPSMTALVHAPWVEWVAGSNSMEFPYLCRDVLLTSAWPTLL